MKEKYQKIMENIDGKRVKLWQRTTDALVLGFTDNIKYDLKIPTQIRVNLSTGYAIENCISDKPVSIAEYKSKLGRVDCNNTLNGFLESDIWTPRTTEGLFSLLYVTYSTGYEGKEADFPMIHTILGNHDKFRREFVFGSGELFKYHDGKREEAEKLVQEFFTPKELKDFQSLHPFMKEFLKQK